MCEIYFKEKYTKGLFFTEETVRTTMRNAKEGDVWKMGQSQLLVFKQNVGVKFLHGLLSHVQKRFPYSYVQQPSRSSIQQTCRPKVSSSMARMKQNFLRLYTDVDPDVRSEWFNDMMFRRLIKLNKYSNKVIWSTFELMLIMIMSINFVESSCWERQQILGFSIDLLLGFLIS